MLEPESRLRTEESVEEEMEDEEMVEESDNCLSWRLGGASLWKFMLD